MVAKKVASKVVSRAVTMVEMTAVKTVERKDA
jgi:hypothetical protein